MVHLRIVAPSPTCGLVLDLLEDSESVFNLIHLAAASRKPAGDVILCDVFRADVSLLIADLRELDVDVDGSIAVENVDAEISGAATTAGRRVPRKDIAADPVIWENVSTRTSDSVVLSQSYLVFMIASMLIAGVGICLNQPILLVGAMVVGPDFGPIAGFCVALVNRNRKLARRSLSALLIGFIAGTIATFLLTLLFRGVSLLPNQIDFDAHMLLRFISNPDFFSVYVALLAGVVGMMSLTTSKSSALVGVLISVATVPAAANMGVAAAYADWGTVGGASLQLVLNLISIFAAGLLTLLLQRRLYMRRRHAHLSDGSRRRAGLPIGSSRRAAVEPDDEPEAT